MESRRTMESKGAMLRNQKGFTLIEIISVLVILGILAAVAIPRYMSLMETARIKAAEAAVAEGAAQVNNAAARYILLNGVVPTSVDDLTDAAKMDSKPLTNVTAGDWQIIFTTGAGIVDGTITYNSVRVDVLGLTGTIKDQSAGKEIPLPQ